MEHFLLLKIHVLMSRSFQKLLLNQKLIFVLRDKSVNLSGRREWSNLYSFIESIRIPEALDYYFKFGLIRKKIFFLQK